MYLLDIEEERKWEKDEADVDLYKSVGAAQGKRQPALVSYVVAPSLIV